MRLIHDTKNSANTLIAVSGHTCAENYHEVISIPSFLS